MPASVSVHVGVGSGSESDHTTWQTTSADRRSPICRDDIQRWIDGAGPSFVYLSLLDRKAYGNGVKTQPGRPSDGRGQTSSSSGPGNGRQPPDKSFT
ncbi:hypothetical protein CP532_6904 [Ophiocordyceps camponoti-leonardi (nom. inval.)]|nr:hypothetical protein CP532_6904 [Ophiocordyceps camponoti-leonardi (nom. inval.)]